MFKGKPNQKQELTGFDILLAMASELRDVDTEYASLYLLMLEGFLMPQEHVMFGHQAVARVVSSQEVVERVTLQMFK